MTSLQIADHDIPDCTGKTVLISGVIDFQPPLLIRQGPARYYWHETQPV